MKKTIYSLLALSSLVAVNADKVMTNNKIDMKTRENYDKGQGIQLSDTNAMTPDVKISGGFSVNTSSFSQDAVAHGGKKGGDHHLAIDSSNIDFEVVGSTGKKLNNLEYSFLISLTGDPAKDVENGNSHVEVSRLQLKGNWGTFMAGVHRGVTDFMSVGAFNVTGGTGGVFGTYKNVVAETTGVVIRDDLMGVAKDYTKVSYITPRLDGLQFGYSYTPDGKHAGSTKLDKSVEGVKDKNGKNIHEVGVNYKNTFMNNISLNLSATGVFGKARAQSRKDIMSYALGGLIECQGFSFGGEFLNNGKSLESNALSGDNDAGKMYTVAAGYKHGDHSYSVSYMNSDRNMGKLVAKKRAVKADIFSVTYDYRLVEGLKLYGEAVHFNYQSDLKTASVETGDDGWLTANGNGGTDNDKKFIGKNKGHAVIVGMAISF